MDTDEIYHAFKAKHPKLFQLNPKVWISEMLSKYSSKTGRTITYDDPVPEITVQHPFLFDNRLIPRRFKDIKVKNVLTGQLPSEFPSDNAALVLEEMYAPENYRRFVANNMEKIRSVLKASDMTEQEALNALTGGFSQHVDYCKRLRNRRMLKSEKDRAFFAELLLKTREAYELSDVKALSENKGWGYSVSATMILKGRPLIVGFNWGVDAKWVREGNEYGEQKEYPFRVFESNYDEMGSLKRTIPYFHEYFPPALCGMQTNFCFFRSEREDQISDKDLELSAGLFEQFLAYSAPSVIISFSRSLMDYLQKTSKLQEIAVKEIRSGGRTIYPTKAKCTCGINGPINFVYLPHPNYPVRAEARSNAWKYCFPISDSPA